MTQIIGANLNDEKLQVWGGENEKIPPGQYQFRVKEVNTEEKEDKEDPNKKRLQMVVTYEVLSGALAGKTAKAWFSCDFAKEGNRKRMKSLVQATGISIDSNGGFDTAQLVGCKLNADVTHDQGEGKVDPITGVKGEAPTFVRVVNEKPFGALAGVTPSNGTLPTSEGVSLGGSNLPGLTPAR